MNINSLSISGTKIDIVAASTLRNIELPRFQRPLDNSHVESIVAQAKIDFANNKEFSFYTPIILAYIKLANPTDTKKFFIIDGYHRTSAIFRLLDDGYADFNIFLMQIECSSTEDMYRYYTIINTNTKVVLQADATSSSIATEFVQCLTKYVPIIKPTINPHPPYTSLDKIMINLKTYNIIQKLQIKDFQEFWQQFIKYNAYLSTITKDNFIALGTSTSINHSKAVELNTFVFIYKDGEYMARIIDHVKTGREYHTYNHFTLDYMRKNLNIKKKYSMQLWNTKQHIFKPNSPICVICKDIISIDTYECTIINPSMSREDITNMDIICRGCYIGSYGENLTEYAKKYSN